MDFLIHYLYLYLQKLRQFDIGVIFLVVGAVIGMLNLFLYCYFGEMSTECYEKISNCLYESNWLDLPRDKQKYFILMIGNLQRPLYYHGFDIAVLNLQTYSQVNRILFLLTWLLLWSIFYWAFNLLCKFGRKLINWWRNFGAIQFLICSSILFIFTVNQISFHLLHVVQDSDIIRIKWTNYVNVYSYRFFFWISDIDVQNTIILMVFCQLGSRKIEKEMQKESQRTVVC